MSKVQVDTSGFGGFAGPVFRDGENYSFDIAEHHLNGDDRLHGGMMMAFASIVLGDVARQVLTGKQPGASVSALSLNCDFVSAGEKGETVTGKARVSRATRTVLFISGDIRSGDRILMTVTGVYAIKEQKGA